MKDYIEFINENKKEKSSREKFEEKYKRLHLEEDFMEDFYEFACQHYDSPEEFYEEDYYSWK